jgi:S1/P1 Nuclease.
MPAVLFLVAVCVPNLFAWGEDGHRIVCRIAYQSPSAEDRREVDRLTKAYATPAGTKLKINAYPDACVFPDEARLSARDALKAHSTTSPWLHFKDFSDWHFLNVARSVRKIPDTACGGRCVLTGIATHSGLLKTGATDQERGEGLIFLGHWLGDSHQPLHVSYANDQGGNLIQPVTGGFFPVPAKFPLNLHSVWDSSIILKLIAEPGWRAFADDLQAKITNTQKASWLTSTPLGWVQESYDITTQPDVQYCHKTKKTCASFGTGRELTEAYQSEFADDVELRLQKAGVRLAAMIHEGLNP